MSDAMWARLIGPDKLERIKRREREQEEKAEAERARFLAGPPAPTGYQRARAENFAIPLICQKCGASVVDDAASVHSAWHALGPQRP